MKIRPISFVPGPEQCETAQLFDFGSRFRKSSSMSQTWKHPQLGEFKHNGGFGWMRDFPLPAFGIFNWEADDTGSSANFELIFEGESNEAPSDAAVEVGALVVANQSKLATLITHTLWEGFNGRGPKSGMWWHGELSSVAESFRCYGLPAPSVPDSLPRGMRLSGIGIYKAYDGIEKPLALIVFSAVFEIEHNVGILTDGRCILGVGSATDVSLYESQ